MKRSLPGNTIVWLDVDSVLLDFNSYFHRHLAYNYDIQIPPNHIPDTWSYDGLLGGREFAEVFNSLPTDWPVHLLAFKGAADFTAALRNLGAYVILVTHVPEKQKNSRIECLIDQGIYFDEIYFSYETSKADIARTLLPRFQPKSSKDIHSIFVDDYMKNILEMSALPEIQKCFSLDYPYNTTYLAKAKAQRTKISYQSRSPRELYAEVLEHLRNQRRDFLESMKK